MQYQNQPLNDKAVLNTTRIIFLGLLAGPVFFMIAVLYIVPSKGLSFNTADPLVFAVPIVAIASFGAGTYLYRQLVNVAAAKETVKEKLLAFQTTFIIRAALFEGAMFFATVTYFTNGNLFFILLAVMLIGFYLTIYPSKDKVYTLLNITDGDLVD